MDSHLRQLLHKAGVMVVVIVMMMMVGAYNYHHLRLRRDRRREAEGKHKSKHKLFHNVLGVSFPRGSTYLSDFFLVQS